MIDCSLGGDGLGMEIRFMVRMEMEWKFCGNRGRTEVKSAGTSGNGHNFCPRAGNRSLEQN